MQTSFKYRQLDLPSSPVHTQSRWRVNKYATVRHACVFLAILLDLAVIGLVWIVKQRDILLPHPKDPVERSLLSLLPTFGSIVGQLVVAVNALSVKLLVTAYAKKKISDRGMRFGEMSYLHLLANKGIPFSFSFAALASVVILLAEGFVTSAIVNSVSPEIINWGTTSTMPIIDLAFNTTQLNVVCENGSGDTNSYGYGINCPLDNAYGVIYNAYIDSLGNRFLLNSTRNGVSYPSSLLGISGSISTLSLRYAPDWSGSKKRPVLPTDTFDACLPKVNVTSTCNSSLGNDQTPEFGSLSVAGNTGPSSIATFRLRNSDGSYVGGGYRFAPVYGNGAISIFQDDNDQTGETVVTILSTGKYAENLTSPTIQCRISASQYFVPVRIVGNTYVQLHPSLNCPTRPEPSPNSLLQVVRIAPLGLVKAQGQDGKLEAIASIPSVVSQRNGGTIQAIAVALERMASVGATEMYGILDDLTFPANDTSENAIFTWAGTTEYTYATERYRLGISGKFSLIFALSPGTLLLCVTWMWMWVGFRKGVDGGFNPLHPSCAAVAGMKREVLAAEVAATKDADEDELEELDVYVKYSYVNGRRLGLEVPGAQQDSLVLSRMSSTPSLAGVPQLYYESSGPSS